MAHTYDVCFVGAGIAALYAAMRTLQAHPEARVILLERNDRVGGRAHNVVFNGTEVVEGAGIGRVKKDKLLRALLEELGLPTLEFRLPHQATFQTANMRDVLRRLKAAAPKYDRHRVPFREFARTELGPREYARFVATTGYRDYEKADIIDTLYHYGFDDTEAAPLFRVPWNSLVQALLQRVGSHRVQLQTAVTSINKVAEDNHFVVTHTKGTIHCKRIVVATTAQTLRHLFPSIPQYLHVASQPFLRVYAKIAPNPLFRDRVATYSLVRGPLQKIIPMDAKRGVYMIAYADNAYATKLSRIGYDKDKWEQLVQKATGVPVTVEDLFIRYWTEGTHYYPPLPRPSRTRGEFVRHIQRPLPGAFVVGEAVSQRYQGWTEGALESVHAILPDLTRSLNETGAPPKKVRIHKSLHPK
jgi:glycine/D-amino acid oxidase-like deaminating enzyme